MDHLKIIEKAQPLVIPIVWVTICTVAFVMGSITHWLAYMLAISPCLLLACYEAFKLGNK